MRPLPVKPGDHATWIGRLPKRLTALGSAPASRSCRTVSTCPRAAAVARPASLPPPNMPLSPGPWQKWSSAGREIATASSLSGSSSLRIQQLRRASRERSSTASAWEPHRGHSRLAPPGGEPARTEQQRLAPPPAPPPQTTPARLTPPTFRNVMRQMGGEGARI